MFSKTEADHRQHIAEIRQKITGHRSAIEQLERDQLKHEQAIANIRDPGRAERIRVARAKLVEPIDKHIAALTAEKIEHQNAGNVAGVASLELEIAKLKIRRHELANA